MNILFVTPSFPNRGEPYTGFHAYLYRVGLSLIELGHKPIILAVGNRNEKWNDRGIEIIRVYDSCISFDNETINYIINSIKISYILNGQIEKIKRQIKIDIIQFTSLNGVSLLYYGKTPSIMRLSSYAKTYFGTYQTFSKVYVKVMSCFERMASKRCNAVYAPCKITADAFGSDINRKVYVIETPFVEDVTDYDTSYMDTYLKGKKYALFFGTIYVEKGIKVIGECLEKFLGNNKEYYYVFAGQIKSIDGENAASYLKRCAGKYVNRIIFLSQLTHKQLYPIIQGADFVTLPSIMENFSNACIEAMYFGKVVIGTEGTSFEQLIRHNESGLLCKIADSDDLLDKMQMAVKLKKDEKNKISINAQKRIKRLRPEIAVNNLINFYNKVIDECKM